MTREEAIKFGNMWLETFEDAKDSNTYNFFKISIKALEQEPKTGHWKLYRDYKNAIDYPQCNICGAVIALPLSMDNLNYCPNCGCKMESEE